MEAHVGDARVFLRTDHRTFDAIVVDAFRFPYVPFHLTTQQFDLQLRQHLSPGGVVCLNGGRYENERGVVDALGATLQAVFPEVVAADAHNYANTLIYAGSPGLASRLASRASTLPGPLRRFALRVATELRPVTPGEPLTDDRAPVEMLTDAILFRTLARTGGAL